MPPKDDFRGTFLSVTACPDDQTRAGLDLIWKTSAVISDADRDELGELLTLIERTLLAGGRVAFPDRFAEFDAAVTSLVTRDFEHIRDWLSRRHEDPDVEQRLTSAGLLGAELRFKRVALELYLPRAPAPPEPPSEKRNTRGLELASDAVKTIGLSLVKTFGLGSAFKEIVELLQTAQVHASAVAPSAGVGVLTPPALHAVTLRRRRVSADKYVAAVACCWRVGVAAHRQCRDLKEVVAQDRGVAEPERVDGFEVPFAGDVLLYPVGLIVASDADPQPE